MISNLTIERLKNTLFDFLSKIVTIYTEALASIEEISSHHSTSDKWYHKMLQGLKIHTDKFTCGRVGNGDFFE